LWAVESKRKFSSDQIQMYLALYSTSGSVQLRDAENSAEDVVLKVLNLEVGAENVSLYWVAGTVCFSVDERMLACAYPSRKESVWDTESETLILTIDHLHERQVMIAFNNYNPYE
jgi:hypothetical protein